ncbi:MAG TPA: D-alanyl-D-alanine carboxypeptidase [Pyrinomonadaceae bacterium]|nr:D-alanyl-D-alanine carboxypeptidase [Pyrinomonadaceae bacterium]
MKSSFFYKTQWLSIAVLIGLVSAAGFAQTSTRPLLQDITVYTDKTPQAPAKADPSLVKKTSSAVPAPVSAAAIKTAIPVLADVEIPGYSGVLVESVDGKVVVETGSNLPFNPASNVKVATSYAVLKTFGPEYRFATNVWTDGSYEQATQTLHGNLYVSGRDPMFGYEHAVTLANELNKIGIRSIQGDLIVTDNFAMNFNTSATVASKTLIATFDSAKRSGSATRVWENYLINSGKLNPNHAIPSVTFTGDAYVQSMPSNAKLLFTHESAPMREILKVMMCYSNNFIAERLGDAAGGPYSVARISQQNLGIPSGEIYLQTSSGLGANRVTPTAMMKVLRGLRNELARYKMTFADIMPVAGRDRGTLENRFDTDFSSGSVIGKTGTLGNTDGGVSSLAGEINTRGGKLLFVIFNQRGNVSRFRSFQNNYVSLIQGQFGGAAPITYNAVSLDARIAKTRVVYPPKSGMRSE